VIPRIVAGMGDSAARSGGTRRILLFVLIGLAIAGLGAGGVVFRAYDKATQIDRRYPEVVVREFVELTFQRRDDERVVLYTCAHPRVGAIIELRSNLTAQEKDLSISTQVGIGSRRVEGLSVYADLVVTRRSTVATTERQQWKFTMVQDDGWRVCGAERLPDPTPTPIPLPLATQPTVP
jgi:hypothetical protein